MADHATYRAIVDLVRRGTLKQPFSPQDFARACPKCSASTHRNFLRKHKRGNGETTELFDEAEPRLFKLIRPLKYDL